MQVAELGGNNQEVSNYEEFWLVSRTHHVQQFLEKSNVMSSISLRKRKERKQKKSKD